MDAQSFPRRWGDYVLIRPLGAGGMGDVYLALHGRPGREKLCVVKRLAADTITDDRVKRFRREAEIVRSLSHGAIAQTLAVDELAGEPFIAQEYIDGRNITQLVSAARGIDQGTIPLDIAIHVVRELARALAYAHGAGIVHRDVAPDNIMVTFAGEVRLIDFGIARAAADTTLTMPGTIVGRWSYSAPEVLAGRRADARADVYASGVVLWELLTGRAPVFADKELPTAPSAVRPELPSALDSVVLRALAANPEERFRTADELQRALGPFLPATFVGEPALRQFIARCYDVEVQRRRLAEEVAEARPLLESLNDPDDSDEEMLASLRSSRVRPIAFVVGTLLALAAVGLIFRARNPPRPITPSASDTPEPRVAPPSAPAPPPRIAPPPAPTAPPEIALPASEHPEHRVVEPRSAPPSHRSSPGPAVAILLDRARDSLQEGDVAGAERAARDALPSASRAQKASAHVILGKVLVLRGQSGAAADEFSDALELDPANEAAAAALARIRRRSRP